MPPSRSSGGGPRGGSASRTPPERKRAPRNIPRGSPQAKRRHTSTSQLAISEDEDGGVGGSDEPEQRVRQAPLDPGLRKLLGEIIERAHSEPNEVWSMHNHIVVHRKHMLVAAGAKKPALGEVAELKNHVVKFSQLPTDLVDAMLIKSLQKWRSRIVPLRKCGVKNEALDACLSIFNISCQHNVPPGRCAQSMLMLADALMAEDPKIAERSLLFFTIVDTEWKAQKSDEFAPGFTGFDWPSVGPYACEGEVERAGFSLPLVQFIEHKATGEKVDIAALHPNAVFVAGNSSIWQNFPHEGFIAEHFDAMPKLNIEALPWPSTKELDFGVMQTHINSLHLQCMKKVARAADESTILRSGMAGLPVAANARLRDRAQVAPPKSAKVKALPKKEVVADGGGNLDKEKAQVDAEAEKEQTVAA